MNTHGHCCFFFILAMNASACGWSDPAAGGYTYLDDYPRLAETRWSNEAQGVAHDPVNRAWYLSTTTHLYRYPLDQDLRSGVPSHEASLPDGCHHFGDPDYYGDELYVPLEGCDPPRRRLYVYSPDLEVRRWAGVDQTHLAWVAVNPIDGLIYTSASSSEVSVFDPNFETGGELALTRTVDLLFKHGILQGGAFSNAGNLYLVDDHQDEPVLAGVYAYRFEAAGTSLLRFIATHDYSPGFPDYEELEGITVWDLEAAEEKDPRTGGQIHYIELDNDDYGPVLGSPDDAAMKHVLLDQPEAL